MSAITTHRVGTRQLYAELTSGVLAEAGKMACFDTSTGKVTKGGTSTTLVPIGTFAETKTGTGTNKVQVDLARHIELVVWANDDAPNAVTVAHRGGACYIKDDMTVSASSASSTRSQAGMVFDVYTDGVAVLAGFGAMGAPGGNGNAATVEVSVNLASGIEADGTPLAAFSAGASPLPGLELTNSKAVGLRWNNHATPDPIYYTVDLPETLDSAQDIVVQALVSKVGATLADATTLDIEAFFQLDTALHDADADAGGTTDALTGDATSKTIQKLTLTIDASDIAAGSKSLTLSVQPTDGLLDTDDLVLHSLKLLCTRSVA
jgi:hypothetical protein